jgi:hypothetical protein
MVLLVRRLYRSYWKLAMLLPLIWVKRLAGSQV